MDVALFLLGFSFSEPCALTSVLALTLCLWWQVDTAIFSDLNMKCWNISLWNELKNDKNICSVSLQKKAATSSRASSPLPLLLQCGFPWIKTIMLISWADPGTCPPWKWWEMKTCVYVKLHTSLSSPSSSTSHTGLLLVIIIVMTIEWFWLPRWSFMAIMLILMNFLHLAHWLAPGDWWDFDDYWMIFLPRWSLMVSSLVFMVIKKVMMPLGMMLTGDNTTSLPSESFETEKQPWSPLDWKQVRKPKT